MPFPHGSIRHQSRPKRADMLRRQWGDLRAIEPTALGYWRFKCSRGHESILRGAVVRRAARLLESGQGGSYSRCPLCKEPSR